MNGSRLDRDFWRYHQDNPKVFDLFLRFSRQLRAQGRKHFGAKAVMERIRWELAVETRDPDGFKLNNNFTSRYVRLLEQRYPEFDGFYRKRVLRASDMERQALRCHSQHA